MKWFLFFLIYGLGEQIQVKLIGTLTASDLFVILYFLFYFVLGNKRKKFLANKEFVKLSKAYLALFLVSVIMEFAVGNQLNNSLKGLAVIVLSYMKLFFLWQVLENHVERIYLYLGSMALMALFFISPEEEASISDVLSGEAYSFFKFKIAPRIGEALVIFSLLQHRTECKTGMLFIFAGGLCIILGARSTGLMIMLTGVFGILTIRGRNLSGKTLLKWGIPGGIALYGVYVVYVNAVLSGAIIGGNSHDQFQRTANPYNPINILMLGRTELPASTAAIIDKPITGHGAWTVDPGFKYHMIALEASRGEYTDAMESNATNVIPAHSVIMGTGVRNGIIAMCLIVFIIAFVIKRGWLSLNRYNPLTYLVVFSIIQLLWNGMFSPTSHFKGMFPFYFVCCLMSYKYYTRRNNNKSTV